MVTLPSPMSKEERLQARIHNIVSGGVSMSESIYLDVMRPVRVTPNNANIDATGAFNGRARMGAAKTRFRLRPAP